MQEIWVLSLHQEDPLEEEMATHSSILAWKIPWTEKTGGYSPWGGKQLDMTEHTCTKCQVSEDTRRKTFSLYNLQTASKICDVLAEHQDCSSSEARCTPGVDDFSQRSENLTVQQRAGANMFRNFFIGYYQSIT